MKKERGRRAKAEDHVGQLVEFGIRHDEEEEGRDEAVLGLQQNIQHFTLN